MLEHLFGYDELEEEMDSCGSKCTDSCMTDCTGKCQGGCTHKVVF